MQFSKNKSKKTAINISFETAMFNFNITTFFVQRSFTICFQLCQGELVSFYKTTLTQHRVVKESALIVSGRNKYLDKLQYCFTLLLIQNEMRQRV